MWGDIPTPVELAAQYVQHELEVTEENAAEIKRRFFERLAESERAQRPPTYGPETEYEYYLRLTSELGGFSEGMVIDPIFDMDILDRLDRPTPERRIKDPNVLAQRLVTSQGTKSIKLIDRVLKANRAWLRDRHPSANVNRTELASDSCRRQADGIGPQLP